MRTLPSVFISYTHDSDPHRERVRVFAEKLRHDLSSIAVEVITDHILPPGGPDDDFRRWSEQQAERSDIVIPIFNDTYRTCWDGKHPIGIRNGGTNEATVIAARVNIAGGLLPFIRAVVFEESDKKSIPLRLVNMQWFIEPRDYAGIVAWVKRAAAGLPGSVATLSGSTSTAPAISWPARCPTFALDMANRHDEFTFFANTLCGAAPERGTIIAAETDHGKTRLVSEFLRYGRDVLGADACCFVDFKGRGTVENLLDTIAVDLGARVPGLGDRSPSRLREGLRKATQPVLFVFDTFEGATEEAREFVETHFLAEMGRANAMRILLAGQPRETPDPAKAAWRAYARRFNLGSIKNPKPWVDWAALAFPLVPAPVVAAIAVSAGGAPGAIANQLTMLGTLDANQLQALGIK